MRYCYFCGEKLTNPIDTVELERKRDGEIVHAHGTCMMKEYSIKDYMEDDR